MHTSSPFAKVIVAMHTRFFLTGVGLSESSCFAGAVGAEGTSLSGRTSSTATLGAAIAAGVTDVRIGKAGAVDTVVGSSSGAAACIVSEVAGVAPAATI